MERSVIMAKKEVWFVMKDPERTFLKWQWPWMPATWAELETSPWLKLFQNAYTWCRQQ